MISYDFGDVVLVPFPFTDQTTSKRRPAIVISSEAYQRSRPDIILIAVTSQAKPAGLFGELPVTEWQKAGLLKPSVIKPVVASVEKSLVVWFISSLTYYSALSGGT
jgi:mRNA interferase MazF